VDVLFEAAIPAWMASRTGLEIAGDGTFVLALTWDVRVADEEAPRAREVIASARRHRRTITMPQKRGVERLDWDDVASRFAAARKLDLRLEGSRRGAATPARP
jgi:hypothetical protein